MKCETCSEYMADFLLDELPESQAVLVHEHLNLCPACMQTYKELKGTGKALEAVPAMKAVEPSQDFHQAVEAKAAVELAKIVERLPPDKRLRLEARRAARQSQIQRSTAPARRSVWSGPLVLLALVAAVIIAVVLVSTGRKATPETKREPLGRLSLAIGKVEQFYQREYEPHTPAKEGKEVLPGDVFSTLENGVARFDLLDGGSIFLGPSSTVTFKMPFEGTRVPVIALDQGELGIYRGYSPAAAGAGQSPEPWDLHVGNGALLISRPAHLYVKALKGSKGVCEVAVLDGTVQVLDRAGQKVATIADGQQLLMPVENDPAPQAVHLADTQPPSWRVALMTEMELGLLFGAQGKVIGRHSDGIEVELRYTADLRRGQGDWIGDAAGDALTTRPEGGFTLPARTRLRHVALFGAPLTLELNLDPDALPDAAFAFGALETGGSGATVDVAGEANLQIREKDHVVRNATIPVRTQPGHPERLRLDIVREGKNLTAVLSASAGKSKILQVSRVPTGAGELWLQGVTDGAIFSEIRLQGVIPADWLREKLSR